VLINVDDLAMFRRWAWGSGRAGGEGLGKWCWLLRGVGCWWSMSVNEST
jgi:hypothetical protein